VEKETKREDLKQKISHKQRRDTKIYNVVESTE